MDMPSAGFQTVRNRPAAPSVVSFMKLLLMLVFCAISAVSQPFGFGVKGGVPLTDFVNAIDTGTLRFNTAPNRYIVGPTIELRLPFGFGIEFDALYRHLQYSST